MVDLVLEIIHIIHGIIHMFLSALLFVFSSAFFEENILKWPWKHFVFQLFRKNIYNPVPLKYPETNTIT